MIHETKKSCQEKHLGLKELEIENKNIDLLEISEFYKIFVLQNEFENTYFNIDCIDCVTTQIAGSLPLITNSCLCLSDSV